MSEKKVLPVININKSDKNYLVIKVRAVRIAKEVKKECTSDASMAGEVSPVAMFLLLTI